MNNQPNIPLVPGAPESIFQTWMKALTRPYEQTFAEMAASPSARASTGYLWYFIGAIVQFLLASLVQGAVVKNLFSQYSSQFSQDLASPWLTILCGAPVAAVFSTLMFGIGAAVVQWIAGMFGGKGTNNQLTYVLSAILAPYMIFSGLLVLPSAIPYVGLLTGLLAGLAGLYILVLEVIAVKGVNRFGWGPAIGSLLVPLLVVGFLCACLVGGVIALLVPVIQQNMPQTF